VKRRGREAARRGTRGKRIFLIPFSPRKGRRSCPNNRAVPRLLRPCRGGTVAYIRLPRVALCPPCVGPGFTRGYNPPPLAGRNYRIHTATTGCALPALRRAGLHPWLQSSAPSGAETETARCRESCLSRQEPTARGMARRPSACVQARTLPACPPVLFGAAKGSPAHATPTQPVRATGHAPALMLEQNTGGQAASGTRRVRAMPSRDREVAGTCAGRWLVCSRAYARGSSNGAAAAVSVWTL